MQSMVLIFYLDIDLEVALQKVNNTNFDVVPSDAIYKDDAQVHHTCLNINYFALHDRNIACIDTRTEATALKERIVLANTHSWFAQPCDDVTETVACYTRWQSFERFCNYQRHL